MAKETIITFVCFLFCLCVAILIALEVCPSLSTIPPLPSLPPIAQHSMVIQVKDKSVEWIVLELKLMAEIASCFQKVKWIACYIFVF